MARLTFALQAAPAGDGWGSLPAETEAAGYEALAVGDHPGVTPSPFVALAGAAPTTTTLKLCTAVANVGLRHPFDLAADAVTVDALSGGRLVLGVGAGHTPADWQAVGRRAPSPGQRVRRLAAVLPLLRALLEGDTVSFEAEDFELRSARLEQPPPAVPPLLVGGNGKQVIALGAAHADIVDIGGLGRTLPDGHFHEVRWRPQQVDDVVEAFRANASERRPVLGTLVQAVAITDEAEAVADRFLAAAADRQAPETLPTTEELLGSPFVMIGTRAEVVAKLAACAERWGITRYTVRGQARQDVADVIAALREGE